VIKKKVETLAR